MPAVPAKSRHGIVTVLRCRATLARTGSSAIAARSARAAATAAVPGRRHAPARRAVPRLRRELVVECPACAETIESVMQVDCRACGTPLRPAELFGTTIRRKAEPPGTPIVERRQPLAPETGLRSCRAPLAFTRAVARLKASGICFSSACGRLWRRCLLPPRAGDEGHVGRLERSPGAERGGGAAHAGRVADAPAPGRGRCVPGACAARIGVGVPAAFFGLLLLRGVAKGRELVADDAESSRGHRHVPGAAGGRSERQRRRRRTELLRLRVHALLRPGDVRWSRSSARRLQYTFVIWSGVAAAVEAARNVATGCVTPRSASKPEACAAERRGSRRLRDRLVGAAELGGQLLQHRLPAGQRPAAAARREVVPELLSPVPSCVASACIVRPAGLEAGATPVVAGVAVGAIVERGRGAVAGVRRRPRAPRPARPRPLHLAARNTGIGRDVVVAVAGLHAALLELAEELGDREAARRAWRPPGARSGCSFRCIQRRKPGG